MKAVSRIIATAIVLTCSLAPVFAPAASGDPENVSFVRVLRVSQAPYQPISIRISIKAPVGHNVYVGFKIFDAAGHGVFSSKNGTTSTASFREPYYATSLTLRWNKVAYDGSRLPRGQHFGVVAYASDLDTNQRLMPSSVFRFTLTS